MKELDIYKQIVQKQDEILKIVLPEIMVDEFRECVVPLMELYNLNQQLEKAQENDKDSMPCDTCLYNGLQKFPNTCNDCGGKEFSSLY